MALPMSKWKIIDIIANLGAMEQYENYDLSKTAFCSPVPTDLSYVNKRKYSCSYHIAVDAITLFITSNDSAVLY